MIKNPQFPLFIFKQSRTRRDQLYQDLFGELEAAYGRSTLVQLIQQYQPDVIVDSINTATTISYQDVASLSKKTYDLPLH